MVSRGQREDKGFPSAVCMLYLSICCFLNAFLPLFLLISYLYARLYNLHSLNVSKNRFSFGTFTFYWFSRFYLLPVFGVNIYPIRAAFCISECLNCVGRSRTSRLICSSFPQGSLFLQLVCSHFIKKLFFFTQPSQINRAAPALKNVSVNPTPNLQPVVAGERDAFIVPRFK